jgi:hypothetical protein
VATNSDDRRGWHVDKTVNISHIMTTIGAVIVFGSLLARMDTRLALLEQAQAQQVLRDRAQDERSVETKTEINKRLDEIQKDIKQLLERSRR